MTLKKVILQKLFEAWPDGISANDFPKNTALTQRIADLKHQDGHDIKTIHTPHVNQYGNKGHHAVYKLLAIK